MALNNQLIKVVTTTFIGLVREEEGQADFQSLFKKSDEKHEQVKCAVCNENTNHSQRIKYSSTPFTQFIFIRLNLSVDANNTNVRYNMKIKNFNPDEIKIPGMNEDFKLKSLIVHEQWSKALVHYTCIVRNNETWLNISDSDCSPLNKLNENMENYFLLLVEKI
jgi:hypothetical protein